MNKLCIAAIVLLGNGLAYGQTNNPSKEKEKELDTVVLVGSRVAARTNVSTPLPIDGVDATVLQSTGQPTMDKALQYRVPSFNATSAAVQDAQSLLDPYEIRNLGASRTLVLVNGKRKNTSSILFLQPTIGKGETGADLSAIPSIAIKRIDILRDGASAQYGSDAIAGVMNVILKDKINFSEVNTSLGLYSSGDGFSQNISAITGRTFLGGSWFTVAAGFQNAFEAKRSGTIDPEFEAHPKLGFGDKAASDAYLKRFPDGNNKNIMPEKTAVNFLVNGAYHISPQTKIYGNSAMVVKYVKSTANHRQPYWKADPDNILHKAGEDYIGFSPTFEGHMRDHSTTLGLAHKTSTDWHIDASATVGGNQVLFEVNNTYNEDLGALSPKSFRPGGYAFNHVVGNLDINKRFNDWLGLAVGAEARHEAFEIMAGDAASQYGSGSISFPGMNSADAGKFSRNNLGIYADAAMDLSKTFLLNLTGRYENYSDFGNAMVWKTSARWKVIDDDLVLRGSASTGFKAPSLHQLNISTKQAAFDASVPGGIVIDGISRNNSTLAIQNQIPKLSPEKAINFTFGRVGKSIST
jgi:iron complex outermembrane recepter protein